MSANLQAGWGQRLRHDTAESHILELTDKAAAQGGRKDDEERRWEMRMPKSCLWEVVASLGTVRRPGLKDVRYKARIQKLQVAVETEWCLGFTGKMLYETLKTFIWDLNEITKLQDTESQLESLTTK